MSGRLVFHQISPRRFFEEGRDEPRLSTPLIVLQNRWRACPLRPGLPTFVEPDTLTPGPAPQCRVNHLVERGAETLASALGCARHSSNRLLWSPERRRSQASRRAFSFLAPSRFDRKPVQQPLGIRRRAVPGEPISQDNRDRARWVCIPPGRLPSTSARLSARSLPGIPLVAWSQDPADSGRELHPLSPCPTGPGPTIDSRAVGQHMIGGDAVRTATRPSWVRATHSGGSPRPLLRLRAGRNSSRADEPGQVSHAARTSPLPGFSVPLRVHFPPNFARQTPCTHPASR